MRPTRYGKLDLPGGHGRILSFLNVGFPRPIICGCDTALEAVEFCRREFNVEAFISNQEFVKVSLPGPFDLIRSESLLTHLNECQATELLRCYSLKLQERSRLSQTNG
jgi:hypothetical protein